VLAYGQTGSGKTHTMGNTAPTANNDDASTPGESHEAATEGVVANNGSMPPEDGVIPRALADLFRALDIKRTNGEVHGVRVRVSYLEIYNEEVGVCFCHLLSAPKVLVFSALPYLQFSKLQIFSHSTIIDNQHEIITRNHIGTRPAEAFHAFKRLASTRLQQQQRSLTRRRRQWACGCRWRFGAGGDFGSRGESGHAFVHELDY